MSALLSKLPESILVINLLASIFVFYLAAQHYMGSRIHAGSLEKIARPILVLNMLRHLGLMFLAPGVVQPGMPMSFALPTALGDCLAAFLASICWFALNKKSSHALSWLWVFNTIGLLDMFMAIGLSRYAQAAPFMGAAYWIPAFWVPMIIVSHLILFKQLWASRPQARLLVLS
jgi:hypothetical protein